MHKFFSSFRLDGAFQFIHLLSLNGWEHQIMFVFLRQRTPQEMFREALKKTVFLGTIPKPVDPPPPIGTFRNKNLNFGQI